MAACQWSSGSWMNTTSIRSRPEPLEALLDRAHARRRRCSRRRSAGPRSRRRTRPARPSSACRSMSAPVGMSGRSAGPGGRPSSTRRSRLAAGRAGRRPAGARRSRSRTAARRRSSGSPSVPGPLDGRAPPRRRRSRVNRPPIGADAEAEPGHLDIRPVDRHGLERFVGHGGPRIGSPVPIDGASATTVSFTPSFSGQYTEQQGPVSSNRLAPTRACRSAPDDRLPVRPCSGGRRMTAGNERFLVTGALGCIGAWTVRALVREGAAVVAFDLGTDPRRLALIMSAEELARRHTSWPATSPTWPRSSASSTRHDITNVIHLAALQVPFCRADPPLGARVNVVGTVNVFEAVQRRGRAAWRRSSTRARSAVVQRRRRRPGDGPPDGRRHRPPAHPLRRVQAGQRGQRAVYWLDDGVPSVGLRPMTVYGVGRDQGMTSGPTKAIVAAVLGLPYRVSLRRPTLYQYAEDVARTLIAASRSRSDGATSSISAASVADGPGARRGDRGGRAGRRPA